MKNFAQGKSRLVLRIGEIGMKIGESPSDAFEPGTKIRYQLGSAPR